MLEQRQRNRRDRDSENIIVEKRVGGSSRVKDQIEDVEEIDLNIDEKSRRSAAKGLKDSSQARAFKITGSPGQSVEEDADLVEEAEGDEEEDEEEEEEEVEEEEEEVNSSEMTASEDETSWISWFVNIRGNDFFCEVEEVFIQDDFNLTNLSSYVPYYEYALDMILDIDIPLDSLTDEQHEIVETAAEVLYGLIHARYILSSAGMHKMYGKYQNVDFGRCPRSFCQGQPVLPVGLSDVTREYSVEVFCPRCHETYHPRSSKHANLDGAYFGTTFCHLFLLTHPELIVPKPVETYIPRIFGFRVNESSQYYKLREANQAKRKNSKGAITADSNNQSSNSSIGKVPTNQAGQRPRSAGSNGNGNGNNIGNSKGHGSHSIEKGDLRSAHQFS